MADNVTNCKSVMVQPLNANKLYTVNGKINKSQYEKGNYSYNHTNNNPTLLNKFIQSKYHTRYAEPPVQQIQHHHS